jgi:DNA-binding NarL/FixJ family response regulator
MKAGKKTRIFLADDHPIVRRGLQLLLSLNKDLAVCGEADNAPAALRQIQELKPDLAIVDLELKSSSGLDLIKQLRSLCPKVFVLVFTMHDEPLYADRVLKAGAHGLITKEEGTEKAIEAIHQLIEGKPYISDRVKERMLSAMTGFAKSKAEGSVESLSDREMQVLDLIGNGLGSNEIAQQLKVSIKTVESHRENIKAKLGLRRAPELVQYAYHWVMSRKRV